MNDVLKLILSLSLSGSILALLLFAAKPIIKDRVSKTFQYYIWMLVLLRLVLPFSFEASLLNSLFYSANVGGNAAAGAPGANLAPAALLGDNQFQEEKSSVSSLPVQQKSKAGYYNNDTDHAAYFNDLFAQTGLLIWILGVLTALMFHVSGYLRFVSRLKQANKHGTVEETELLRTLLDGMKINSKGISLYRNRLSTTPMLIGLFRPCIIIPDLQFTQKQLESILKHELTHFRYRDIAVKWITVIVASLHWFNPFMILVKREINRVCELSCDERVIRDLSVDDRQAYGETLLSVVAEREYPIGVLSTTMCEEKKTLKERLTAIMKFGSMSKQAVIFSVILLIVLSGTAIVLGAGIGKTPDPAANTASDKNADQVSTSEIAAGNTTGAKPGAILSSADYNLAEITKHKTEYVGNNSKVMALVGNLPLPEPFFIQQYLSLKTKEEPYGITAYYEAAADTGYPGDWPISAAGSKLEINSKLNALVLFAMIGNAQDVTFAFCDTKSTGNLDQDSYDTVFSFSRVGIEYEFGDLSGLAGDQEKLAKVIDEAAGRWSVSISRPESQAQIREKTDKLLTAIMSSPMTSSNSGDYIRAHQIEYNEIVVMGKDVLPYLKSILDSGDKGLRGVIVTQLCSDIENQNN